MEQLNNNAPPQSGDYKDEISIFQLILFLLHYRKQVIIGSAISLLCGLIYAILAPSIYMAEATIAPKESTKETRTGTFLSQLGNFGNVLTSQLGLGNTNLDKMEIFLKSHDLAKAVILNNNLLPLLFESHWDSKTDSWKTKDSADIPSLRQGIELLQENIIKVSADKEKKMIKLKVFFSDSNHTKRIADLYLVALNEKIQDNVITESNYNQTFLTERLRTTHDPLLKEKILSMIAFEIERTMLISKNSFDIVDNPIVPHKRSKPKRKLITVIFTIIGFFTSILFIITYRTYININQILRNPTQHNVS